VRFRPIVRLWRLRRPAIVSPVSIGRGKIAVAALALALGVAGGAAAQPVAQSAKKKVKVVFFKAHVRSDGFLTPGQPETVTVFDMPPKTHFRMAIEPPPITLQCGQFFFCDFAPALPAPGSPPFRTNKKGEAVVTFMTPTTYNISTDPFDPSTRRPVAWANAQRVHIDIQGVKRLKHKRKIGFGFGRAAIQT
jgi:hypothetical protein